MMTLPPAQQPEDPGFREPLAVAAQAVTNTTSTTVEEFAALEKQLQQLESSCASPHKAPPVASPTCCTEQPDHHSRHEESFTMNATALRELPQDSATAQTMAPPLACAQEPLAQASVAEADGVLNDVQNTLDSLAGMANGLQHQRQEMLKVQQALEERRAIAHDRERLLAEWEERLRLREQSLQDEKLTVERAAEQNASILAERSASLQALAQTVESRDRAATMRAELQQQEQRNLERLSGQLRTRAQELEERDAALQRQAAELALRLKQLVDAKDRFGAIVKGFNETVRFNTALSEIGRSVATPGERA